MSANPPSTPDPPPVIRNAKDIFMAGPHAAAFRKIIQTAEFEAACQAALVILVERQPTSFANPSNSWDTGCVISGARQVLDILARLPLPQEQPRTQQSAKLNYNA